MKDIPQVVVSVGIIRFETERLLEARACFGGIVPLIEHQAQVVVGFGKVRFDSQSLPQGRFRIDEIAHVLVGDAKIIKSQNTFGIGAELADRWRRLLADDLALPEQLPDR